jgi:hypothetical protein
MAEEDPIDVIRISCVRQYMSSDEKLRTTPVPFCEMRAYVFRKTAPLTRVHLNIIRNLLINELMRMEKLFKSIDLVKNELPLIKGKDFIFWQDKYEEHLIQSRTAGKKPFIAIDGLEISRIDGQELLQFFRGFKKRIKLGFIYRYACFYNTDGTIKKEYGEEEISQTEAESATEALFG